MYSTTNHLARHSRNQSGLQLEPQNIEHKRIREEDPKEAESEANGNECRISKELDHESRESHESQKSRFAEFVQIRDQK
jgi:hypothetical protein